MNYQGQGFHKIVQRYGLVEEYSLIHFYMCACNQRIEIKKIQALWCTATIAEINGYSTNQESPCLGEDIMCSSVSL
jgi:hypothetical protein